MTAVNMPHHPRTSRLHDMERSKVTFLERRVDIVKRSLILRIWRARLVYQLTEITIKQLSLRMPFSVVTCEALWNKIVRGKMLEYRDKKFHEVRQNSLGALGSTGSQGHAVNCPAIRRRYK